MNSLLKKYKIKKLSFGIIGILICIIFAYILDVPEEMSNSALLSGSDGRIAMKILGITMLAIFWWIGSVLPDWTTALAMLVMWILVGNISFSNSFSAFSSTTVWLIIGTFFLAEGVTKTGLFKRISYFLLKIFPPTYKGQILSLLIVGTICSPLIPSVTAKALLGSSIANNMAIAEGYGDDSNRRVGLFMASWFGFALTAPAFMTGGIFGYTVLGSISEEIRNNIDWVTWFISMLPWLLVFLVSSFLIIPFIYDNPEREKEKNLENLLKIDEKPVKMSRKEKNSAIILVFSVILWVFESVLNINAAVTALIAAILMFAFDILEPKEISTAVPWGLVIFLGAVLNIGNIFTKVGLDIWLQGLLSPIFVNLSNRYVIVIAIFFSVLLVRLVMASQSATIVLMLSVFAPVVEPLGISPFVIGLIVYTTMFCWFMPYQNVFYIPALASMNNTVSYNKTVKGCFAYEIINLLACLVSIPFWIFLGYM